MKRLTIALLAVTLLAGCGRVVEEVADQAAEQAIERGIESDSGGDVDIEFAGGDIPDELTMGLPDGYEVLSSSTMTDDTVTFVSAILEYPADDLEEVVAFFEDEFASMEDSQKVESSSDGNNSWSWYASDASVTAGVYYVDGDPTLTVNITQQN